MITPWRHTALQAHGVLYLPLHWSRSRCLERQTSCADLNGLHDNASFLPACWTRAFSNLSSEVRHHSLVPQEAYRLQLRCFLGLVHEQRHLPMLKELLQLYTAVSLRKLASLMDLDEATVRGQLMLLKARPRAGHGRPVWSQ